MSLMSSFQSKLAETLTLVISKCHLSLYVPQLLQNTSNMCQWIQCQMMKAAEERVTVKH